MSKNTLFNLKKDITFLIATIRRLIFILSKNINDFLVTQTNETTFSLIVDMYHVGFHQTLDKLLSLNITLHILQRDTSISRI